MGDDAVGAAASGRRRAQREVAGVAFQARAEASSITPFSELDAVHRTMSMIMGCRGFFFFSFFFSVSGDLLTELFEMEDAQVFTDTLTVSFFFGHWWVFEQSIIRQPAEDPT